MLDLQKYLSDPCGASSLPYYKAKHLSVPEGMLVLHERDFSRDLLKTHTDERYFRLIRARRGIEKARAEGFCVRTANLSDAETISTIINGCYDGMRMSAEDVINFARAKEYDARLWVIAEDAETGAAAGCGIAEYDAEARECSLEWIQVLGAYRRRGVGRAIVTELLVRAADADFCTVSGKADAACRPEALYRACGFTGDDIWHVLTKVRI